MVHLRNLHNLRDYKIVWKESVFTWCMYYVTFCLILSYSAIQQSPINTSIQSNPPFNTYITAISIMPERLKFINTLWTAVVWQTNTQWTAITLSERVSKWQNISFTICLTSSISFFCRICHADGISTKDWLWQPFKIVLYR